MAKQQYLPDRGDAVWIQFNPQSGHEQAGYRPALVLSPKSYNQKVGLAVLCPITTQVKGYPFEVLLPAGIDAKGAVLSDQIKNLDWRSRKAKFLCKVPKDVVSDVSAKIWTLVGDG